MSKSVRKIVSDNGRLDCAMVATIAIAEWSCTGGPTSNAIIPTRRSWKETQYRERSSYRSSCIDRPEHDSQNPSAVWLARWELTWPREYVCQRA